MLQIVLNLWTSSDYTLRDGDVQENGRLGFLEYKITRPDLSNLIKFF